MFSVFSSFGGHHPPETLVLFWDCRRCGCHAGSQAMQQPGCKRSTAQRRPRCTAGIRAGQRTHGGFQDGPVQGQRMEVGCMPVRLTLKWFG
jgi:hypothetical protein